MGQSTMTPYYVEKLGQGLEYQDFVMEKLYENGIPLISYSSKKYQVLKGENKAGIEIKNDQKFRTTGNFYIETDEKSNCNNKEYYPSGVFREDNTWLYILGDYEEIYVFSKKQLQLSYGNKSYKRVTTPTSKGFLLPLDKAINGLAIKIIKTN